MFVCVCVCVCVCLCVCVVLVCVHLYILSTYISKCIGKCSRFVTAKRKDFCCEEGSHGE